MAVLGGLLVGFCLALVGGGGSILAVPILVYVVGIVAMGWAALTTDNVFIVGGAVMLMASDGLLATERFLVSAISPYRSSLRVAVWVLYYIGQLLVTLGFILK